MNFSNTATASKTLSTKEIIDHIFKDPSTTYELTEFENLGKPIHDIIAIYPKTTSTGRDAGKVKYFLKSFIPFSSGNEEVQVFVEGGKSAPEEIVRQLWIYKLVNQYGYKQDEIDLEAGVQFGVEVGTKAADIIVYTDNAKDTPKIIVECKKPKRKDGIEQLKSYMNAKGAPVAVWSNGSDSIILYRPYPKNFDDTLFDIPKRGQEPKDVLEAKKTLLQLKRDFNFKKIIQDLEELVLADSGKDEFNEIFKLIFAKIWDEKEALENRKDKTVEFSKALDPDITFDRINGLFKKACEEWPGIFKENEDIELAKRHLQVCVGPIEGVRLMGSNLRIMDDAFEYLLPTEAKKKKGPRTFMLFCRQVLATDFKAMNRVQLGEAPQLLEVGESGEFKRGTLGESKESYKVKTYGRVVAITRQTLINDDLDAFTRIPAMYGNSIAQLESDVVWGIITSNPAMADGNALFHSTHKNLAATGTALAVDAVGAARAAMALQTGFDKKTVLNIRPAFLIVPAALELKAEQLVAQNLVPADSTKVVPQSIRTLSPISEPRLDAASPTAWYLAASPNQIDTIEYAYLEGQQ